MSDMAMLRIGILVAGILLLVAIFLFGRPKKPSQGRRIETAERDTARVEPSLAGDDTSEQMRDYNEFNDRGAKTADDRDLFDRRHERRGRGA